MGNKHHGHSFGGWHWHHSHHHHHHHHHHKHLIGSRDDDVLEGSRKSDVIIGRNGDDELFGNRGNDRLYGGRGDDLLDGGKGNDRLEGGNGDDVLDGGAGNDTVFGGKGDDVLIHAAEENANACGRGDFYDGGKGYDVLNLVLTQQELDDPEVQAELEAFLSFLEDNANECGSRGKLFKFEAFDLTVRNFEALQVNGGEVPPAGSNTPPEALADAYAVREDIPLNVNVNEGVLTNDSDADGDALSAVLVDAPLHGTLEFDDDGSFKYTPEADYNGPDSFTYRASDGADASEVTNVVIDVTPVNDPPRMVKDADWGPVTAFQNVRIDILDYYEPGPADESNQQIDFELENDTPFFTTYGIAGRVPDTDTISYTALSVPPGGATDSFEYIVFDDAGGFSTAVFEIDVI